jgi:hypothetical protein
MKPKLILCLALVLSGGLFGCSTVPRQTMESPPVTLGQAFCDFDRDGTNDVLSLVWVSGKHYVDDEIWCGEGEKYSGKFIFRVQLSSGTTVDTPFDLLKVPFDFFFFSNHQPWPIFTADYNNDGQPDFNIISYGSCNRDACCLFTVLPSGKVEPLEIEGIDWLPVVRTGEHSTAEFNLTSTGFYYTTGSPFETGLEFLDWDAKQRIFHLREEKINLRNQIK